MEHPKRCQHTRKMAYPCGRLLYPPSPHPPSISRTHSQLLDGSGCLGCLLPACKVPGELPAPLPQQRIPAGPRRGVPEQLCSSWPACPKAAQGGGAGPILMLPIILCYSPRVVWAQKAPCKPQPRPSSSLGAPEERGQGPTTSQWQEVQPPPQLRALRGSSGALHPSPTWKPPIHDLRCLASLPTHPRPPPHLGRSLGNQKGHSSKKGEVPLERTLPALPVKKPPGDACPLWKFLSKAQASPAKALPVDQVWQSCTNPRHRGGRGDRPVHLSAPRLPGIQLGSTRSQNSPKTARWVQVSGAQCAHLPLAIPVQRKRKRERPHAR